ncbi:MAG: hypothetical protein IID61_18705 [SAR324 cluster bacterium]|nr:hypothetical protein [SAR324 cluster bacterium]
MRNNVVHSGIGTGTTAGIELAIGGVEKIVNNTIYGGSATGGNAMGIRVIFNIFAGVDNTPVIENNVIFAEATGGFCIHESLGGADPVSVQNNNLFGCAVLYRDVDGVDDMEVTSDITIIDGVNSLVTAGGNVEVDPMFFSQAGDDGEIDLSDDNDWHLTDSTPIDVSEGGLNLSLDFSTDLEGNPRTTGFAADLTPSNDGATGWSMGAYEF